jgi:hypothetical protein
VTGDPLLLFFNFILISSRKVRQELKNQEACDALLVRGGY